MDSTTTHTPRTCTVPEAAQLLRISRTQAYRLAAAGEIPTVKFGRRILVPLAWIDGMLGAAITEWEAS